MKWESAQERKLTWQELWQSERGRLSFLLRAVYDVLPSPANLHTWGLAENPSCKLCGKRGSLEHVLSSCQVALTEGRYRWRHDQVLATLADKLDLERLRKRTKGANKYIQFMKAGGTVPVKQTKAATGTLATADDWELLVDLKTKLKFPQDIVDTRLRPDVLLLSRKSKQLVMVELTVPWEERMEEAYARKKEKYEHLVQDCKDAGWKTNCYPV